MSLEYLNNISWDLLLQLSEMCHFFLMSLFWEILMSICMGEVLAFCSVWLYWNVEANSEGWVIFSSSSLLKQLESTMRFIHLCIFSNNLLKGPLCWSHHFSLNNISAVYSSYLFWKFCVFDLKLLTLCVCPEMTLLQKGWLINLNNK